MSDVAYVHTLHGHLRRMVVRAFVMSFRRTFGMSLKLLLLKTAQLTLIFCFVAVQIALASMALVIGILSRQRKITR